MRPIPPVTVGDLTIGPDGPVLVIAEMSGNHNGSLDRALEIVRAVAAAGAQALKLQTYTADTMTIDFDGPAFRVEEQHPLWGGRSLHALYEDAHTPWDWHEPIFDLARELGLLPFSTPFDVSAVEFLEELGVALYKTASAEIVDLPLIREVAATGKPVVMSTGMATLGEVDEAVTVARDAGCQDLVLLACTAAYPAVPEEARLHNLSVLRDAFDVQVGLSDHTLGIGVSLAAVSHGAVALERHVTLDRDDGGVDSAFSLVPTELALLVEESERARIASNSGSGFGPTDQERAVLALRRSLYVTEDVREGEVVSGDNVRSIRPSGGLSPRELDRVLGRRFTQDVSRGTPLSWDLL